ncbi:MAG: leucine-rich repeat domain-containing protein [Candidatus Methanoplasma sp.]|nr:leucine-rich repeat domain-containing protein [Candidatus Methanoplasma sp.]
MVSKKIKKDEVEASSCPYLTIAVLMIFVASGCAMTSLVSDDAYGYSLVDEDGFYYTTSGTTATVTGASRQSMVNVEIPNLLTYSGRTYTVTGIGNYAFQDCSFTNLTINTLYVKIGTGAFKRSTMVNVVFKGNLSVDKEAFYGATFVNATFLGPVISVGDSAFARSNISKVPLGDGLTSIGTEAFYGTSLAEVSIPDSVTTIGARAFANTQLKSVNLGKSVQKIGTGAFANTRLTEVKIPLGAMLSGEISESAFDSGVKVTYGVTGTVAPTKTQSEARENMRVAKAMIMVPLILILFFWRRSRKKRRLSG